VISSKVIKITIGVTLVIVDLTFIWGAFEKAPDEPCYCLNEIIKERFALFISFFEEGY
jgi:hypothetical protein